jgi:serine/threonine protein kinase
MMAFQKLGFTADDVARSVEGSGGIVGAGSSGTVYRAKMPNGDVIAVKKLRQSASQKEAEVLGRLRHRNIVRLLGWCTDGQTTLLLYEYMPNGSLHDLLHGKADKTKELDWAARHRIAVGVAQGVSYLHHDCLPAVAHRDLKPSNVLLDAHMEPRVADFGVAKALHQGAAPMSVVAGSYGYIAPGTK